MLLIRSSIKPLLYTLTIVSMILLLLSIIIAFWINEYSYTDGVSPIGKIVTSNLVRNINGTSSFKIKLTRTNEKSNLSELFDPNAEGLTTEDEYIVNGSKYSVEIARMEWSDFFKSFGLSKSYKVIFLSSNYDDTVESVKYPTDSFRINGGSDEFLKYVSQNPELSRFFFKSIVFDKKTYEYLDFPLIRTIK